MNDVEERLRRQLLAVVPAFEPVRLDTIAGEVRRRRRVAMAGTAVSVLLVVGAAVTVPRLARPGDPGRASGGTAGSAASTPAGPTVPRSAARPAPACPPTYGDSTHSAAVDYVDFVSLGGRQYVAADKLGGGTLPAASLGGRAGVVRCALATIQPDPEYRPRDGDAGYLPAGTPLYSVVGYPSTFRLAAPASNGRYRSYEVDTAPAARVGADLLPLGGKVVAVEIRGGDDGTHVLARLTDRARIGTVVAGVLTAPVDQRRLPTETPLFVHFGLADGTAVDRAWFRSAGVLQRGIELPPAVNAALLRLLPAGTPR